MIASAPANATDGFEGIGPTGDYGTWKGSAVTASVTASLTPNQTKTYVSRLGVRIDGLLRCARKDVERPQRTAPIQRTDRRGKCAEMHRDAEYQKNFRIFQPQLQDLSAAK